MSVKEKSFKQRVIKALWVIFLSGIGLFLLLILLINLGWLGYMPSMKELENPKSALASDLYATDGELIGRYYVQDRSASEFEEISPNVFNALIATEDSRFYEHSGVDGRAVLRAVLLLGKEGGGSTITQQLAKNLFPRENNSKFMMPIIKLKEWVMAVKLEKQLTKNEIITLYLNTVPFGSNVYGIRNASLTFFNKPPDKLKVEEAAVLIGMLKASTAYNPKRNPDKSMRRRNTVIDQMAKYGYLTVKEAHELKKKPLVLNYHKLTHHDGIAPYFRQVVEQDVKEMLKDLRKADGSKYNIYKDGLKIYTTIDVRMQQYAEAAVEQHISEMQQLFLDQRKYKDGSIWNDYQKYLDMAIKSSSRYEVLKDEGKSHEQIVSEMRKPVKMTVFAWNKEREKDTLMSPIDSIKYMKMMLQAGFMAMDPFTGEVKAWVGGINHTWFQYDHVNINTRRQVGSTIKPLLYCLAVDNGYSPCGIVSTAPQSFPTIAHYDAGGSEKGPMTMKQALAGSINNAALYLIKQVGINSFADFLEKCGVETHIDKVPSLALGVPDVSLYEMMRAYSMFPTGGTNVKPLYITKIEDKDGNVLKSFVPTQKELINKYTAFKMVRMMQGVADFGTAKRLRYRYNLQGEIAGKTGTTNNQADAWFIGYTPQIMAGSWVGCDDRYLRFGSERLGQGAAAALPIWAYFMQRVYADKSLGISPESKFEEPENYNECDVMIDPSSVNYGSQPAGDLEFSEHAPAVPDSEW
ncbi:MAG: transglycosylase domain-containing protein [Taibaiella sp.]|nr:transglycosylase domain-containing protein [Taibaiella sp.]